MTNLSRHRAPAPAGRGLGAILCLLALYYGANGLVMLAEPAGWFAAVPGARETGPLNHHFVRDVGITNLAVAAAALLALRLPPVRPALLAVMAVIAGGHAGLHAAPWLGGPGGHAPDLDEIAGVLLPALAIVAIVVYAIRSRRPYGAMPRTEPGSAP